MSDKRNVTTDALETLGTIISEDEKRDAIHLGVENVVCGEYVLQPGQHIGFLENGTVSQHAKKLVGIVDPFLTAPVREGQQFWLVVYPRKITSLRHVWTHPDFPDTKDTETISVEDVDTDLNESKQYIANLANDVGVSYNRLVNAATEWLDTYGRWGGTYLTGGEEMDGYSTPYEFWDHYEKVTGNKAPEEKRESFFSCSC